MTRVRPAIVELTSVRTKEFIRETEAVFWVFGFPIILALALGFAFRDKAPERVPVAIVQSPAAPRQLAALQKSPALIPRILSEEGARDALRHGKVSLIISVAAPASSVGAPASGARPGAAPTLLYRFDPTRPDSRIARRA